MRILSIDVGQTTGMAYGIFSNGSLGISWAKVIRRGHFYNNDLYLLMSSREASLNVLIVEYPIYNGTSAGAVQTQAARKFWESVVAEAKRVDPELEIVEVRPVDWKQTPVNNLDLSKGKAEFRGMTVMRKLTAHEKDAIKMIHWYCTYKLKNPA